MKVRIATECGISAEDAWERLRNNTNFYEDKDKTLLNIESFVMIEKPYGIDFLGLGKLFSFAESDFSPAIASCFEETEDTFVFLWLA